MQKEETGVLSIFSLPFFIPRLGPWWRSNYEKINPETKKAFFENFVVADASLSELNEAYHYVLLELAKRKETADSCDLALWGLLLEIVRRHCLDFAQNADLSFLPETPSPCLRAEEIDTINFYGYERIMHNKQCRSWLILLWALDNITAENDRQELLDILVNTD